MIAIQVCPAVVISHSQANYYSDSRYSYDISPTRGYHSTYGYSTAPVGSFPATGYGLHDMTGNLMEWCWDNYGERIYVDHATDPRGAAPSKYFRVYRGGCFRFNAYYSRAGTRTWRYGPTNSDNYLGFRIVRSPSTP